MVHWYRNVFNLSPWKHVREVAAMLKAIHAQEDKEAARAKAGLVVEKLRRMKLEKAAELVEKSVEESLSYMDFPYEHWTRLRTNNGLERIMKEIRRRTRVVGSFPDGYSAMMLVGARLRHLSTTKWWTNYTPRETFGMNSCLTGAPLNDRTTDAERFIKLQRIGKTAFVWVPQNQPSKTPLLADSVLKDVKCQISVFPPVRQPVMPIIPKKRTETIPFTASDGKNLNLFFNYLLTKEAFYSII